MDFFGFDLLSLLKTAGYIGIFGMIFAESSFLFFLPGDSLLFAAGVLASQNYFSLPILVILCFIAAVLGNSFAYAIGRKMGPRLFRGTDSWLFNSKNLSRAEDFYARYGGNAVTLARFIPAVRTFVPVLAGVGTMRYRGFIFYNVLGAFLWAVGLPFLGYFLGQTLPEVDRYLLPIVGFIIVISILPAGFHYMRNRNQ